MHKDFEAKLVNDFPTIFKFYGGDPKDTCMAWGMSCGDGWFDLIYDMCDRVDQLCKTHPKDIEVVADQVKEKFGGLRFYYHVNKKQSWFEKLNSKFHRFMGRHMWGRMAQRVDKFRKKFYKTIYEEIDDVISDAEINSYVTCENCGRAGTRRGGGWVRTLCEQCEEEYKNK
jgi:hypothetical protein